MQGSPRLSSSHLMGKKNVHAPMSKQHRSSEAVCSHVFGACCRHSFCMERGKRFELKQSSPLDCSPDRCTVARRRAETRLLRFRFARLRYSLEKNALQQDVKFAADN